VLVLRALSRESVSSADRKLTLPRLTWLPADVVGLVPETPRVKTIRFTVDGWSRHLPGQHVDIRLTAEDGYQAERSYSIASAPDGNRLELTVERLDDGEVSPYLTEELRTGDQIELRGPVGGYFVWHDSLGGPLFLVGGGSGVVPLMAMLRQRAVAHSGIAATLLLSSRSWEDVIYRDELERLNGDDCTVVHTLTRARPPGWTGYARRVDADMLREVAPPPREQPQTFVCGPTPFVEVVASALVELGHDPRHVKTERFGATGG
jgi:ferredoxin-NADP reductase